MKAKLSVPQRRVAYKELIRCKPSADGKTIDEGKWGIGNALYFVAWRYLH